MAGFEMTVIDDRSDYVNRERFTEVSALMVGDFTSAICHLPFTGSGYVVIVTRGHKHDTTVLEHVISKPTR
jgi:xanthine dehydrogenase accessory factor